MVFDEQSAPGTAGDELCCIILSRGNPPELIDAVRSVAQQDVPVEIVVVNSGGGNAGASLLAAGLGATVIDRDELLLPGGARNAGIAVTRAPFVAFLAGDCLAETSWASERIKAHRAGADAVASSVTNPHRHSIPAWASYIALFSSRMPGTPENVALRYGASYRRSLFTRYGTFREDLRGGEDTEFHARFGPDVQFVWAPAVRTAHRHPVTLSRFLRDQYRRGARSVTAWGTLQRYSPLFIARNALRRAPAQARLAWSAAGEDRPMIALGIALLPLAAAAYALGAIVQGRAPKSERQD